MRTNQFNVTKQIIEENLKQSHAITPTEKLVLIVLSNYFGYRANEGALTCYPSQKTLADKASCSTVAVNHALKKFENLGFIKSNHRTTKKGGTTSKLYTWLGIPKLKEDTKIEEASSTNKLTESIVLEEENKNDSEPKITSISNPVVISSNRNTQPDSDWLSGFEQMLANETPY